MEMALEEPLNQRFVLLSESDIPLYPPAVVWLQLMSEQKSRIHACNDHFVSTIFCLRTFYERQQKDNLLPSAYISG